MADVKKRSAYGAPRAMPIGEAYTGTGGLGVACRNGGRVGVTATQVLDVFSGVRDDYNY